MRSVAHVVWTAGYSGLVPVAPGTAGSLVGTLLVILLRTIGPPWLEVAVLVTVVIIGVWAAGVAEQHYGRKDPGAVVIDEVAGVMVALGGVPVGWAGAATGFLAFRLFDIAKPFPVRASEQLPGGWGIMADDLAAGLYAHAAVRVLAWLAPSVMFS